MVRWEINQMIKIILKLKTRQSWDQLTVLCIERAQRQNEEKKKKNLGFNFLRILNTRQIYALIFSVFPAHFMCFKQPKTNVSVF